MKLTLIRISEMVSATGNALTTPPVGVAYLAAYLRARGHDVAVIDGVGERVFQYTRVFDRAYGFHLHGLTLPQIVERINPESARLIGVSCMFSQDWPVAKELIARIRTRFPRSKILCGGEHITAMPEYSLRDSGEIDFCILQEGEATLLELVEALEKSDHRSKQHFRHISGIATLDEDGQYRPTILRPRIKDLDALPYPAWDLVPMENYLASGSSFGVSKGRNMPIVASRGCPYACAFCSNVDMWAGKWSARNSHAVVDEIEHYVSEYRANNFDFYDLTMIVRKDWILAFCAELEKRQLDINYQLPSGTRCEAIDQEVAAALQRTGCCHIVYAPESGSERTLRRIGKQISLRRVVSSMKSSVNVGTFVKANIVLGFPGDGHLDTFRTFLFLLKMAWIGVHDVFVYTFSPYPGTPLFKELQRSGRLGEIDQDYFFGLTTYIKLTQALSYTEHISDRALTAYRLICLVAFYSSSFLFHPRRVIQILRNLSLDQADTRIEQFIKSLLRPSSSNTSGLVLSRKVRTAQKSRAPGYGTLAAVSTRGSRKLAACADEA